MSFIVTAAMTLTLHHINANCCEIDVVYYVSGNYCGRSAASTRGLSQKAEVKSRAIQAKGSIIAVWREWAKLDRKPNADGKAAEPRAQHARTAPATRFE